MRKTRRLSLSRETLHRLEAVRGGQTPVGKAVASWETDESCWWLTEDQLACLQTATTSD